MPLACRPPSAPLNKPTSCPLPLLSASNKEFLPMQALDMPSVHCHSSPPPISHDVFHRIQTHSPLMQVRSALTPSVRKTQRTQETDAKCRCLFPLDTRQVT